MTCRRTARAAPTSRADATPCNTPPCRLDETLNPPKFEVGRAPEEIDLEWLRLNGG